LRLEGIDRSGIQTMRRIRGAGWLAVYLHPRDPLIAQRRIYAGYPALLSAATRAKSIPSRALRTASKVT
jgi:hypothetical protein